MGAKDAPRAIPGLHLPQLAEAEPVWAMQQLVPNARTVPASTYVVKPGETLLGVSNRSGAGAEAIAKANGLVPPYGLRAGQKLSIPAGRYHLVAEGETGIAIATAYGVAWSRIVAINDLNEPFLLRKGRRLLLPDDAPRKPRTMEERAAAFRIDIDDVLTGGQPALGGKRPPAASREPRPLPSNVPIAEPKAFAGSFIWPVRGVILSGFGPGAGGVRNNGIDIAVPAGTAIHAAADGVVAYAGDRVAVFGGLMLINHGGGWVSAYGHASRVDVVRGQKITKGQIIGLSGDSGYASRPKLHFELRKDRTPVDPVRALPARIR
ncbi:M23 family metallopeptidase [Sphingobium sp.]|uniref:M23 family metallopeptidase n=1 Tax=Sphingobium sp. TaxID=1912891 RepID=UPI0028BD57B1|nr:M23 family metallopeptidase [Sphingobium sp.]